ncbi:MAG: PilW family protein [Aquirhabdus sp.]
MNSSASIAITRVLNRPHKKSVAGFTLIELMISIVLGLLIVAAASQLLVGGLVSSRLQQGAADTQDSGLFGLDYVAKDIRLANYGNPQNLILNDQTPSGGMVLTSAGNLPSVIMAGGGAVPSGLLTHGAGDTASGTTNEWQGLTKVTVSGASTPQSDQLTIQFLAPAAMANCEGTSVNAGDRVIQRYFLRADATDSTALVLACDAGSVSAAIDANPSATPPVAAVAPTISNFGDAGQVVMQRVEHMHILLGTQDGVNWRYYTVNQYMALTTTPKPQIKSIQMSVLVRSLDNTNSNVIDPTRTFAMLDQTVTPTANQRVNRYVRRVYSTTIALRNGLGSS